GVQTLLVKAFTIHSTRRWTRAGRVGSPVRYWTDPRGPTSLRGLQSPRCPRSARGAAPPENVAQASAKTVSRGRSRDFRPDVSLRRDTPSDDRPPGGPRGVERTPATGAPHVTPSSTTGSTIGSQDDHDAPEANAQVTTGGEAPADSAPVKRPRRRATRSVVSTAP